jgi:hypothetical protein
MTPSAFLFPDVKADARIERPAFGVVDGQMLSSVISVCNERAREA